MPQRPVVLTIGDGAFAYNPVIPSYDASNAYGLPLLVVVFNNRVYKSMNLDHRRFYPDGAAAGTGEWLGTDLRRLPRLANGVANARPELTVERGAGAVAVLDADRAPGPVALTAAAEEAVTRARTSGVAAVGVRRTVHTGAIGHYVSRIAEQGLIGIAFVAGMPNMGYTGAKGAAAATRPLAIAVPARSHATLLLDMATATIVLGRIRQAGANGTPLPEGAAATADGTPTTDPERAVMPLPLGAKGSGMSLAFELLTNVLVGAPVFAAFHSEDPGGREHRQNALIIALDQAAFGDVDAFTEAVDATRATLKGLPPADGAEGVHYPGERSAALGALRGAEGVPVAAKVWRELTERAATFGVPMPEVRG